MNKLNKILILFIITVTGIWTLFWMGLQSEATGRLISNRVSKQIQKHFDSGISFKNIQFSVFPPGAVLNNVKLEDYTDKELGIQGKLNIAKVGVYFNILDIFANKISIKNILIEDGELRVNGIFRKKPNYQSVEAFKKSLNPNLLNKLLVSANRDKEETSGFNLYDIFKNLIVTSPVIVRGFEFKNVLLRNQYQEVMINRFRGRLYRRFFDANLFITPSELKVKDMQVDSFAVRTQVDSNYYDIKKIQVKSGLNILEVAGKVPVKGFNSHSDMKLNLNGVVDLDLSQPYLPKEVGKIEGVATFNSIIEGSVSNPKVFLNGKINDLKTKYSDADSVDFQIKKSSNVVWLEGLSIISGIQEVNLELPVKFFKVTEKKFLESSAKLKVKNIYTNNALKFLGSSLEPLKLFYTGDLEFKWSSKALEFILNDGYAENFKLQFPKSDVPTLINKKIGLPNYRVKVDLERGGVSIGGTIKIGDGAVVGGGIISREKLDIQVKTENIDLERFGPISGLKVFGVGSNNLHIYRNKSGVLKLETNVSFNEFEILNFKLGRVSGFVDLDLTNSSMKLENIKGRYNRTSYNADGNFRFKLDKGYNLNIDIKEAIYADLFKINEYYVEKIRSYFPEKILGNISSKLNIRGNFEKDSLLVDGELKGGNLALGEESFKQLSFKYNYTNKKLKLNNILLEKEVGSFFGSYDYNFNNFTSKFNIYVRNIEPREFFLYKRSPFGLNGQFFGNIKGRTSRTKWYLDGDLALRNADINGVAVEDSNLNFSFKENNLKIKGNLFEDQVLMSSSVYFLDKSDHKSSFNLDFDFPSASLIAGLISHHNVLDKELTGNFRGKFSSSFTTENIKKLNANLVFDELNFKRKTMSLILNDEKNQILVENGVIKKWDIQIAGLNNSIASKGEGDFSREYKIITTVDFDGSLLEVLNSSILSAGGNINAVANFHGNKNNFNYNFASRSNDLFMSMRGVSGLFENMEYQISLNKDRLSLEKLKARYSTGTISANGEVILKFPYPKVSVNYNIEKTNIQIFKKSFIVISGNGKIVGDGIPYSILGTFVAANGSINEEPTYFIGLKKSQVQRNEYAPQGDLSFVEKDLILFDLVLDARNGVWLRNSLGELKVNGNGRMVGSMSNILLDGKFNVLPGTGKLFFKNNEFLINRGEILFDKSKKRINPDIDFIGKTKIEQYAITLGVWGDVEEFNIDLSSDPPLSRDNLVSLLAFGVTEDQYSQIDDASKQSLTSLGVGSILFERFKINQELKSNLGLKISLAPEVFESETSLLEGSTAGSGQGNTSRLRSATKIRVQKDLTDELNLSVSSTLGETENQKQEMNLDYKVNDNMSILGIYEIRTVDDGEETNQPSAFGLDLIFRVPFK